MFGTIKKIALRGLDYYVFSNLHIALVATLMSCMTSVLFIQDIDYQYLGFIFFSTLAAYSLHWALSETNKEAQITSNNRAAWTMRNRSFLWLQCVGASVIAIYFLLLYYKYTIYILPVVALTFLYTAPKIPYRPFSFLRGLAFAKTFYLATVWVYATTVLPLAVSHQIILISNMKLLLFCANRFLFIYPICILFDYRDRHVDYQNGIKNIYVRLSQYQIKIIFLLFFVLFQITNILLLQNGFTYYQILALSLPFFALLLSLPYALRSQSDHFFYAYLDGLMAAAAIFFLF